MRTILHLDMDAFYASVEERDDPSLAGLPVVVGGDVRRGVVTAASYEARRYGVRSAMPMARALRLCPQAVVRRPRFERYAEVSEQVFGVFGRYTPLVEGLSLDEAFLDVTASRALFGGGEEIARKMKSAVREATGLTCSAGVAEVKFAAKIASDLCKPDGLLVVPPGGVRAFLDPLPIGRLWGVGQVTEERLTRLGLATIGDVARAPWQLVGQDLHQLALGIDPREVVPDREAKSVGHEDTFEEDLRGEEELAPHLLDQALRVGARLRASRVRATVVTLKVKYHDHALVTRRATLPEPSDDGLALYKVALELGLRGDSPLFPTAEKGDSPRAEKGDSPRVRLTGVSASGLVAGGSGQLALFGDHQRREKLNQALDQIAGRFGEGAVVPGDLTKVR